MKDAAYMTVQLALALAICVAWYAICKHTGVIVGLS